jgi:hypothetical protein
MTAEIKTVIGQLSITGGTWRGDAPNQVAVREPKSADAPGAGKGDLFVLTEVRGPVSNRDTVERQLAQTIRDTYYLARGSITASLRRALQTGSDQLYRHNQQVSKDKKVVAGAVTLVVRDDDAFVAQTGPTALFAVLSNYIRRYPIESVWLDEALEPQDAPALGTSDLVEPNLHHLRISPDDMLILADSRLAGQLPLNEVLKSVTPRNVKATVKSLGKVAQAQDCSALVLSVVEAESSTLEVLRSAPDVLKKKAPSQLNRIFGSQIFGGQISGKQTSGNQIVDRDRSQPASTQPTSTSTETAPLAAAVAEPSPAPEPVVAEPARPPKTDTHSPPNRQQGRFFSRNPKATRSKVEEKQHTYSAEHKLDIQEEVSIPEESHDLEQQLGREAKELASTAQESSFSPEWRRPKSSLPVSRILRWVGASLLILVALLGSGLKNILTLVLPRGSRHSPRRQAGKQAYQHQPSHVSWALLRNIAIAIPLLIAIVVSISYLQKGRTMEAEYNEFITTAKNKFQQAQAITPTDPGTALGLMNESEAALVEAEKIKANQPEITELRQQMAAVSDEMSRVQRLYYLPQLHSYPDSGTNLKRLVIQGVEIYVLDTGTDRLFRHRLDDLGETLLPDDGSPVLVSPGQPVEEIVVSDLLDMTWMPAGGNRQTSDLVILNSTGLLEYNPNWGMTTSALSGGELMALPVAVSSYFGNFYVLDPQANHLLRYLPTADGYSAPPENYFPVDQPVDLTNAVDFAIDGAIYILFKDGRLNKYQGGLPTEFNLTGLDKPFNSPVAVFTAPDEEVQYVYVADASNQRVVQLEKDGRFVRQFKPREGEAVSFANLQDIFVDEIGGRLYILDSNNLYVANIPSQLAE